MQKIYYPFISDKKLLAATLYAEEKILNGESKDKIVLKTIKRFNINKDILLNEVNLRERIRNGEDIRKWFLAAECIQNHDKTTITIGRIEPVKAYVPDDIPQMFQKADDLKSNSFIYDTIAFMPKDFDGFHMDDRERHHGHDEIIKYISKYPPVYSHIAVGLLTGFGSREDAYNYLNEHLSMIIKQYQT